MLKVRINSTYKVLCRYGTSSTGIELVCVESKSVVNGALIWEIWGSNPSPWRTRQKWVCMRVCHSWESMDEMWKAFTEKDSAHNSWSRYVH